MELVLETQLEGQGPKGHMEVMSPAFPGYFLQVTSLPELPLEQ